MIEQFTMPGKCFACDKDIQHADVVFLGFLKDGDARFVAHPTCLGGEKDKQIKEIVNIHVHQTPGKRISPAKQITIQKRIKELVKAISFANANKAAREASQIPS